MQLLYGPASPFVRKVMVLAHECGLAGRIESIPIDQMTLDSPVWTVNPLGKLPALVRADGCAVFDSPVICEYLDSLHDGPRLFPPAGEARWRALGLQALGDGLMAAAVARTVELRREPAHQSRRWLDRHEQAVALATGEIARRVAELDEPVTIGHVTVACALGYLDFRYPESRWRDGRAVLAKWFEDFSARPSMVATVPQNRT